MARRRIHTMYISLIALITVVAFPASALASTSNTGVQQPVGADAATYTFNQEHGYWENEHFIWDPSTYVGVPKTPYVYSYNATDDTWSADMWQYNSPRGTYDKVKITVNNLPPGAITDGSGPTHTSIAENTATGGTQASTTDTNIGTTTSSSAQTGNAVAANNTTAGDVTTGDSTAMINLINMVQSSFGGSATAPQAFQLTVDGDVHGDLTINPHTPSTPHLPMTTVPTVQKLSVDSSAGITHDVSVQATSGDAATTANTTVGRTESGNANAVANVMNLINSQISAGQSFVGVVNIQGALDGDILLPPELLSQILASNAPSTSLDTGLITQATDTEVIANTVHLAAETGKASADYNTTAGSVASGTASTQLTLLNLTGRNIIGDNAILVFVNVLGQWVGMIMDKPGTTAALGGSGAASSLAPPLVDSEAITDNRITNTINVSAASGSASAAKNTTAGDVLTGNATASANILNVINSNFSIGNWFGILFINVFGSWHGSFGVDTDAGGRSTLSSSQSTPPTSPSIAPVFGFRPAPAVAQAPDGGVPSEQVSAFLTNDPPQITVHGASRHSDGTLPLHSHASAKRGSMPATIWGLALGMALLGTERVMTIRDKHRRRVVAP